MIKKSVFIRYVYQKLSLKTENKTLKNIINKKTNSLISKTKVYIPEYSNN